MRNDRHYIYTVLSREVVLFSELEGPLSEVTHALQISLKFDEIKSKAPIEKLDHIKFCPRSYSSVILGFVVTWKSWFWRGFFWWFQLCFSTYNWSILHHRDLTLASFLMPYQMICNTIMMILKVKESSCRAYPAIFTISKTDSFNLLIFSLKVSLVKLLYFPKFQLGTEMGSWDM